MLRRYPDISQIGSADLVDAEIRILTHEHGLMISWGLKNRKSSIVGVEDQCAGQLQQRIFLISRFRFLVE